MSPSEYKTRIKPKPSSKARKSPRNRTKNTAESVSLKAHLGSELKKMRHIGGDLGDDLGDTAQPRNGSLQNGVAKNSALRNGVAKNRVVKISQTLSTQVSQNGTSTNGTGYPPFPKKTFSILYADPPWDYKGQLQHNGAGGVDTGGAIRHYPTVKTAEMSNWPIDTICAEDALLFMWATSPHLDQAIDLGKAWGFDWATVAFVWDKQRTNPGFYTLSEFELCLVLKRGKIPTPRGARNIRQRVTWKRENHSRKPPEVRKRIEKMFPGHKRIELFAREKVRGWTPWGWEI